MLHMLGRFPGSARLYCPREGTGADVTCYNARNPEPRMAVAGPEQVCHNKTHLAISHALAHNGDVNASGDC